MHVYSTDHHCSAAGSAAPGRAVVGGWGWRVQGSAAVRPADFAPTV